MQLKKEIDDRTHLHKNLEQLYEGRLKNIQTQLDTAVTKNTEYDKMVKYMRKKSAADKDALVKVCSLLMSHAFTSALDDFVSIYFLLFLKHHPHPNLCVKNLINK